MSAANTTYGFREFLEDLVSNNSEPNAEIYGYLCRTDLPRLEKWRTRLDRVRAFDAKGRSRRAVRKRGQKSQLAGKIFERLIRVLLDGCRVITHDGNVRTTISEIDFRLKVEPLALNVPMFRVAGNHAIGEAKCVVDAPKSEWVTEFAGILTTHNASLGLLFTMCTPRKVPPPARTAIALLSMKGQHVIPFGVTQINQVANGGNFLQLLSVQYTRALTSATNLQV